MTEGEATELIKKALQQSGAKVPEELLGGTDLVKSGTLDSLQIMTFLFELEMLLGRKIEEIYEEYNDFRPEALTAILAKY